MDRIEDFLGSNASADIKNAATQAIEKLKIYYGKTDATVLAVATIIDPRLKLFYHEEQQWERVHINRAKSQIKKEFANYQTATNSIEAVDEIEDELLSQIYKQHKSNSKQDELNDYLMATRALPTTNVLQWWKVKNFFSFQFEFISRTIILLLTFL